MFISILFSSKMLICFDVCSLILSVKAMFDVKSIKLLNYPILINSFSGISELLFTFLAETIKSKEKGRIALDCFDN
jgi:hypothetical protein